MMMMIRLGGRKEFMSFIVALGQAKVPAPEVTIQYIQYLIFM